MSIPERDEWLDRLSALPPHDVDPETAARIARAARAAFVESATTAPWRHGLGRFYARTLERPLVLAACAAYLTLTVQTLNATGFAAAERLARGGQGGPTAAADGVSAEPAREVLGAARRGEPMVVVDLEQARRGPRDEGPGVLDRHGLVLTPVHDRDLRGIHGQCGGRRPRPLRDQAVRRAEQQGRSAPRAAVEKFERHRATERGSHHRVDGVRREERPLHVHAAAEDAPHDDGPRDVLEEGDASRAEGEPPHAAREGSGHGHGERGDEERHDERVA